MSGHPRELLMAYADGELDTTAAAEIERHLRTCTECGRELAIVRDLKGAMRDMQSSQTKDLWSAVNRRLTTPAGWLFVLSGALVWIVLAVVRWFRSELTIEWAATTALLTGLILLLVAIGYEQYREWKSERYKDVQR
ncbi:MAG TPA: zf-HC2 domain-containing protein [Thermoanaerobaculia bacterium]|nr:zf-HC2 domain-containing protein [Thermoanaerobaculia bacterium]